jgi:secreted Zn-dependent insulinase-like peptidase
VSVELSDLGLQCVNDVVAAIFAYIGMLKRSGPQDWIWQEMKDMSDMKFCFLDRVDPADYVTQLANNMQIYEPQHIIAGSELLFVKNLQQTFDYVEFLDPEKCLVFTSYKGFSGKTTLQEKWYGTEHNIRNINEAELSLWKESFAGQNNWKDLVALPKPNPFIPTDFSLRPRASEEVQPFPILTSKIVTTDLKLGIIDGISSIVVAEEGSAVEESNDFESVEESESDKGKSDSTGPWNPVLPGKTLQLFHKQDSQWNVPKVNVYLSLESCFATCSPWNTVMTDLFHVILTELMNEYSYYADCAG